MAHARRFRFGLQLHKAADAAEWQALARKAEDLGYGTVLMPDHFGDQLAPIPALMAAADATSAIRVGCLVHDNDYKHPVVLAKELATIDVLSGGRLEIGVGAGWMLSDYEQAGISYDSGAVRVARFEEGVQVIKRLMGSGACTFAGEHYQIEGLDGLPKPVQSPHPPILIGGGKRRMLTFAGREADIVGINPTMPNGAADADAAQTGTAEETDRKLGWVREGAGDRFDDLEINLLSLGCFITDDRADLVEKLSPLFGLTPEQLSDFPHALVGTTDELIDIVQARRDRWEASYVVVQQDSMDAFAPVVAKLAGT
ncbi:MAG: Luciferase [Acidimicrobiales bacterium]|nr:Luciferase [Acidimicrobiales bacterium]